MKRLANLRPQIATRANLSSAFYKAAAGKRRTCAVEHFAKNLDAELNVLVTELGLGSWTPGPFQRFVVRDPKVRVIHAAPFRDRVVHHAIMNVAGPGFERGASEHSYACRLGRGNRAAVRHARDCTRAHGYLLKLDIRKYFDSIRHDILRGLFRRRFKDDSFLRLLDRVLDSFQTSPGRGLPIGTLTSQYFANFYLDGLDRWIHDAIRPCGYARYMDDFVLWDDDHCELNLALDKIVNWLAIERGLVLKGEPRTAPCEKGLGFLGYRITPTGIFLGRTGRRRFRQRLLTYENACIAGQMTMGDLQSRANSLLAFTEVAECRTWRRRVVQQLPLDSQY